MARKKRERQKVIRGRVPSDARNTKSRSIVTKPSKRRHSAPDRSIRALWDIRHGVSPSQAARDYHLTLRSLKRELGAQLIQDHPGGRIRATKSDRLVRYLQIAGPHGPVEVKVHGTKEASEVARYKAAVNRLLGGDLRAMAPWHGKRIADVELITATSTLKDLAQKELLPYSVYRSLSGGAA
jgi:hypothetical protein